MAVQLCRIDDIMSAVPNAPLAAEDSGARRSRLSPSTAVFMDLRTAVAVAIILIGGAVTAAIKYSSVDYRIQQNEQKHEQVAEHLKGVATKRDLADLRRDVVNDMQTRLQMRCRRQAGGDLGCRLELP